MSSLKQQILEEFKETFKEWKLIEGGYTIKVPTSAIVDFLSQAIDRIQAEATKERDEVVKWATGNDTGLSSTALCRFMMGLPPVENDYTSPVDADDRGRCIRLLNLIPEWWDRLDEMATLPSRNINVFGKNGFEVREEGWKKQIPLIKKEAGKLVTPTPGEGRKG